MNLKNHTYYFGKVPEEVVKEGTSNWDVPNYYFRFRVTKGSEGQINFEDSCGRVVPFEFENLCEMRDTLDKMILEIAAQAVGANYNDVS